MTKSGRLLYCAIFMVAGALSAQADTILSWDFQGSNTFPIANDGPVDNGSGTALGNSITGGTLTFDTVTGDGSTGALHATDWVGGDGVDSFQFDIPVNGFSTIGITWDQSSSAGGPGDFNLQWSTNGTSWNTVNTGNPNNIYNVQVNGGTYNNDGTTNLSAWNSSSAATLTVNSNVIDPYQLSYEFSAHNAIAIRMVLYDQNAAGGSGSVTSAGATRIDNVEIIEGAPEPATWIAMLTGLCALWIFRLQSRRFRLAPIRSRSRQ